MPRAKKNRPAPPTRQCAICGADFVSHIAVRKYCDDHKDQHAKRAVDRRKLGAKERGDYYKPKICSEPGCDIEFIPKTGSAKYCDLHKIGAWERRNPDKAKEKARRNTQRYRHKRDFGDGDIYAKLVEKYGETCAICGAPPEFNLAVDHDHATLEVRRLLCSVHNAGLGYFQDDPKLLRAAANYLELWSSEGLLPEG